MTAVVVLEHCSLDMEYEIPAEATGIEGSSVYLKPGEKLTVEALLYCMMLQSGNDAAVALALACSDNIQEFVDLMNLKAQQLSLRQTHFDNPNGLDGESHYSTASDMAKLTRYALQNPDFRRIVATKRMTCGGRSLCNHNKLLWSMEGAIGVKTGFTKAAGRILVSAAERKGRTLIAVTMNDGNDWQDHKALYDFGFSQYQEETLIHEGDTVAHLELMDGSRVPLIAASDVKYNVSDNENLIVTVLSPKYAFCPGAANTTAGTAAVRIGTKQIGLLRLLWADTEKQNEGTNTENTFSARCSIAPCSGKVAD